MIIVAPVQAQITPDDSLGNESSVITPNATIKDRSADLIEGGAIRDRNLFHSFSDFNVGDGNAVYFASPEGINNILTRVTGDNISNVFGTLGINGTANLFLLNPNGIIFGENAALDINGSFFATTAQSYIFGAEETKFSASNPDTAPLLNVNLTPGLQMGNNPGKITVQGNGHLLTGGVFFPIQNNSPEAGLRVDKGQTLSLIGGEIELDGGIIKTAGGNIELTSIKAGNVSFNFDADGEINISRVASWGDIKFKNSSLLDAGGIFTGNIRLQGKNISIEDASAAIIQNLGFEPSGKISVQATDSITLSGSVRNAPDIITPQGNITGVTASRLTTETLNTGKGGSISISGKNLFIEGGSSVSARSFSNGKTGNIELEIAELINIDGTSVLNPLIPSLLSTTIFNSGNSGTIDIYARDINLFNGGILASLNFGSGMGGDINLSVVDELKLSSFDSINGNPSTLASTVYRTGNSSNVTIDARRISLFNGGQISTATLAEGDAGRLIINTADYIKITGMTKDGRFESSIASDGEILPLNLQQLLGVPNLPSGDSGNIVLTTPQLIISDKGNVAVGNRGLGDSGSLSIKSDRITLDNNASITAFSTSGQGGNIDLQVNDWLLLKDRSAVTAQTTANSTGDRPNINGGNININTDIVTLLNDSQINASATEGNGGNINITAQGLFVSADSSISATSDSELGLDGEVEIETISGDRPITLTKLSENLIGVTEHITTGCNTNSDFEIVGKGGLPDNPIQNLRGQAVWQDLRIPAIANATNSVSKPGSVDLKSVVEAASWQVNQRGNVELVAIADNSFADFGNNSFCQSH